jgi:hypothetical protein
MGGDYCTDTLTGTSAPVLLEVSLTSCRLLVPQHKLSGVLSMLSNLDVIEGYGSSEEAKQATFNVTVARQYVKEPVTARERELQKELEQRSNWWQEERRRADALKKKLEELSAPGVSSDEP